VWFICGGYKLAPGAVSGRKEDRPKHRLLLLLVCVLLMISLSLSLSLWCFMFASVFAHVHGGLLGVL
jgi:hypothetical protein